MKVYHLTRATIKQFMRDKKSLALLILCPLLLITIVFLSFNPDGLQRIPAGMVLESQQGEEIFSAQELSFFDLTEYESTQQCLQALRTHRIYLCIHVRGEDPLEFTVHYDNTREPIILEILEKTQQSFSMLQQETSIEMTTQLLDSVTENQEDIQAFIEYLSFASTDLSVHQQQLSELQQAMNQMHQEITANLNQMDEDVTLAKAEAEVAQQELSTYTTSTLTAIDELETVTRIHESEAPQAMQSLRAQFGSVRQELVLYEQQTTQTLQEIDTRLSAYQEMALEGSARSEELEQAIYGLEQSLQELAQHEQTLLVQQERLGDMQAYLQELSTLDAEEIINPFSVRNRPAFIPEIAQERLQEAANLEGDAQTRAIQQAINIISLQTRFPAVLLLIVLFLSLLISSFATLKHINSKAYQRIRTTPHLLVEELASIAISSLLLLAFPMFIILFIGQLLFSVAILQNIVALATILFLLSTTFILFGILLSTTIRNESITLVIITFMFVFLTFFSGFILATERMSTLAAWFSSIFPPKIALSAINQVALHQQTAWSIGGEIIALLAWTVVMLGLLVVSEMFRRSKQRA